MKCKNGAKNCYLIHNPNGECEECTDFISKCTVTKVGEKYIAQSPMGFYLGSYSTDDAARAKILLVSRLRVG